MDKEIHDSYTFEPQIIYNFKSPYSKVIKLISHNLVKIGPVVLGRKILRDDDGQQPLETGVTE